MSEAAAFSVFHLHCLALANSAPWPQTQKKRTSNHTSWAHNKLTRGSGWCSTQLMPVLIRAWKYYLGLAARSKKSIVSQVINSALSDCSRMPGSCMSLRWPLCLWNSLYDLHFHATASALRRVVTHVAHAVVYYVVFLLHERQISRISRTVWSRCCISFNPSTPSLLLSIQ